MSFQFEEHEEYGSVKYRSMSTQCNESDLVGFFQDENMDVYKYLQQTMNRINQLIEVFNKNQKPPVRWE